MRGPAVEVGVTEEGGDDSGRGCYMDRRHKKGGLVLAGGAGTETAGSSKSEGK
jgi:hypothetical protein